MSDTGPRLLSDVADAYVAGTQGDKVAGKYSAKGTMKMEVLEDAGRKVDRIAALTEQYAGARTGQDQFIMNIIRTATTVQRALMTAGYGPMADTANQIVMCARRGGTPHGKARNLREQIISLRGGVERGVKGIMNDEKDLKAAKAATKEAG